MTKSYKKRLLFAKAESSYKGSASIGGGQGLEVFNLEVTPFSANTLERNVVSDILGNREVAFGTKRVQINFDLEITTKGTAGQTPLYHDLLRACGMKKTGPGQTVVYNPQLNQSSNSCRILYIVDGLRQEIKGCRGSFSINCKAGEIPYFSFSFSGVYAEPTDGSTIVPNFPSADGPHVFGKANSSDFEIDGTALVLDAFTLDAGNVIENNESVGGTDEVRQVDRAPTGSCVIECPTIDEFNLYELLTNTTDFVTLTLTHGSGAGKQLEFSLPKIDIRNITYSEINTVAMANIEFHAMPNTGDDEFLLTIK